jgi:hypothetical protein
MRYLSTLLVKRTYHFRIIRLTNTKQVALQQEYDSLQHYSLALTSNRHSIQNDLIRLEHYPSNTGVFDRFVESNEEQEGHKDRSFVNLVAKRMLIEMLFLLHSFNIAYRALRYISKVRVTVNIPITLASTDRSTMIMLERGYRSMSGSCSHFTRPF